MPTQYDLRRDRTGWTVFDRWTDQVVVLDTVRQVGLTWEAARELLWRLRSRPGQDNRTILQ